ncbi:MAG: hypothetical protein PGN07_09505 [Aeromicrobium erythreum]
MRRPAPVPPQLTTRAFHRSEARALGITPRQLQHDRFVEVFPRVYRLASTELDAVGLLAAARASLPPDACISHQTRFLPLGLDVRATTPLHFTVDRDLHLDVPGIFLHRTARFPPHRDGAIDVEGAVLGTATTLRLIDLVQIIDWLLHRGLLDLRRLRTLMHDDPWRPGIAAVEAALELIDPRSRSLAESETRVLLVCAGLPRPESNLDVHEEGEFLGCGDLVYRWLRLVIEYEGRQHALSTDQFQRDIVRYARFREAGWSYVQVTRSTLARPRAMVLNTFRVMQACGYDGPAPSFGRRWLQLFEQPVRHEPQRLASS